MLDVNDIKLGNFPRGGGVQQGGGLLDIPHRSIQLSVYNKLEPLSPDLIRILVQVTKSAQNNRPYTAQGQTRTLYKVRYTSSIENFFFLFDVILSALFWHVSKCSNSLTVPVKLMTQTELVCVYYLINCTIYEILFKFQLVTLLFGCRNDVVSIPYLYMSLPFHQDEPACMYIMFIITRMYLFCLN